MLLRELTLDDVVEVTGGALVDGPQTGSASGEERVTSVSTDTRSLAPGALFVALRGEKHDAHDYVAQAVAGGAAALVLDRALHPIPVPHVVVPDTLHALGDIARYIRDAFTGPVVGVTGSIGKTTAKEMIADVLACNFNVLKSEANHNNEIGVSQTIFGLEERHTALVLEMAMRGSGQIHRLAEIGAPAIGVITNVGISHIELLGSREAIARAKGELLELLPADKGLAVLPLKDEFYPLLRSLYKGRTLTCAIHDAAADVVATDLTRHENGWRFTARTPWGHSKMFVPSPGRFNVLNALFAVAVGGHLGIPIPSIARALNRWEAPPMRLEIVTTPGGVTILSDAYNAAPDSMIGALETLRDTPTQGRRIAVLGEMRELGDHAAEGHATVGRAVARLAPDLLLLVGPLTSEICAAAIAAGFPKDCVRTFPATIPVAESLPMLVGAGDVVLIKGSRAMEMEKIVDTMTPGTAERRIGKDSVVDSPPPLGEGPEDGALTTGGRSS